MPPDRNRQQPEPAEQLPQNSSNYSKPMLIGQYQFSCAITRPAIVPSFKGSMLRGAFGHSFKKISCALRRQDCHGCLLSETCPYSLIFENHSTTPANSDSGRTRIASRPHPYVLAPPADQCQQYREGEKFSFGITLFGKANDYLPHIIYAIEMMGENGIGRQAGGQRGTFDLEQVFAEGQCLYDGQTKVLSRNHPLTEVLSSSNRNSTDSPAIHTLAVTFKTPLRLKHQNELQDTLPFHLLIRSALRRISTLEHFYGTGEPDFDYRGLIRRAETVSTVARHSRWIDLERYSARQKTSMLLGGLAGAITYAGELDEFIPLLRYCEQTHLGKQTTFGLGQIAIQENPTP